MMQLQQLFEALFVVSLIALVVAPTRNAQYVRQSA
jgi:hypothetical protein